MMNKAKITWLAIVGVVAIAVLVWMVNGGFERLDFMGGSSGWDFG